ncbi:MAG: DoxX family protein [Candidatus Nanopelagicales bacterium]
MTLPTGTKTVIGAFAVSGAVHLARPQVFEPLVPEPLGPPRPWVYGSGVLELLCAAGLATRQPWAPALTTATLAGIWVGNLKMALDVQRSSRPVWQKVAVWVRMPVQVPLMKAAWASPTG